MLAAPMSNKPDPMRLSTALLISALVHAGLAVATWYGPVDPGGESASTPAARPLTARLVPSVQGVSAPRAPAPTPSDTAPSAPARAAQRTQPPHPLGPINLDIPEASLPTVHGTLILKLWIDDQGKVVAYEPEPTDLPAEYVTAVGDTLTEVRFAPAQRNGHPVAATYRIEIDTEPIHQPQ